MFAVFPDGFWRCPVKDPGLVTDHGTAHQDLAQLSGFGTACNPDCVDIQFAVHLS